MPYQLTQNESISQGLGRIIREEVDYAIRQLRTPVASKRDTGIHEARKSIKRLRGVVRLVMPVSGKQGKRDNATLRDIGRSLSELRDAAALVETVDGLIEKHPGDIQPQQLAAVRLELVRRRDAAAAQQDDTTTATRAVAALRNFKRRVNARPVNSEDFAMIAPGLKKTYRRGRKALALARGEPAPLNYHNLRKRVKDHWYHVRLFEGLWTVQLEEREKNLKDLQEWLGDDHNLVVLQEKISAEPALFGNQEAIVAVSGMIEATQKELRENSLALGERVYEEKPGAFTRRLRRLWDTWHAQPRKGAKQAESASNAKISAA